MTDNVLDKPTKLLYFTTTCLTHCVESWDELSHLTR